MTIPAPARDANERARVLIVDDHAVVREGLAFLLKLEPGFGPIECVGSASEAFAALQRTPPNVVVLDLALGNASGIDLIKRIHRDFRGVKVLVLSMHDEQLYAERCLRAGASGYIMKSEGHERVITGLREVLEGRTYVSETMRERILQQAISSHGSASFEGEARLSDRELEVYRLIGQGRTTLQIAHGLGVSPKTIQTYRNNLKLKLGISSASELIHRATTWAAETSGRGASSASNAGMDADRPS